MDGTFAPGLGAARLNAGTATIRDIILHLSEPEGRGDNLSFPEHQEGRGTSGALGLLAGAGEG
jgi:hypothetical protein